MKNLLAIISGILTCLILTVVLSYYLAIRLDPGMLNKIRSGNYNEFIATATKIMYLLTLIIFPLTSFLTGLIAAFLAKNKEYLIGFVCVLPNLYIFFDTSRYYFLSVISVSLFMVIGVKTAKFLKKKIITERRNEGQA